MKGLDGLTSQSCAKGTPAPSNAQAEPSAAFWSPMDNAPQDGSIIWAYLYHAGIRKVRWMSAAECAAYEDGNVEDYDGSWVEVARQHEDWSPRWWAPLSSISTPGDGQ